MYGAEAVILDLCRCMRRGGETALIGVFANSGQRNTELEARAQAEGIAIHTIACRGQLDLSVPSRLRDLVRTQAVNVVHAHGYKADVYAYWALRNSRTTALVSTCHTWYDNDLALRLYGMLDRLVLRRFGRVVAVSEAVWEQLLRAGVCQNRVRRIRNGVDLRSFAAVARSPLRPPEDGLNPSLTVGLVGRLAREKGVDLYLRAAAAVLEQAPSTRFVVVGDGPDRAALEALIGELSLTEHATLLGRRDDMPGFYGSLDLMVSASRQEGLPVALLEGMASGLPIVAAAAGEIPNIVQQDRTGLLVPVEDPQALASAILQLLTNPDQRLRMGCAGRTRVTQEFSADRMTTEYLQVYQEAVAEKRA